MDTFNFSTLRVFKNGTGLAVIIPVSIQRALLIQRGDHMLVSLAEPDVICMRKLTEAEILQIKPPIINYEKNT